MDRTLLSEKPPKMTTVLAVASGGGHWIQLLRIRPAFTVNHRVVYLTTKLTGDTEIEATIVKVIDANIWEKGKLVVMFLQVFLHVVRIRPDVVITTGAAPGLAAIIFGKLIGARTIWIDSLANAEALSRSGKLAKHFSDLWLTQWSHLASPSGPSCWGRVL